MIAYLAGAFTVLLALSILNIGRAELDRAERSEER